MFSISNMVKSDADYIRKTQLEYCNGLITLKQRNQIFNETFKHITWIQEAISYLYENGKINNVELYYALNEIAKFHQLFILDGTTHPNL